MAYKWYALETLVVALDKPVEQWKMVHSVVCWNLPVGFPENRGNSGKQIYSVRAYRSITYLPFSITRENNVKVLGSAGLI